MSTASTTYHVRLNKDYLVFSSAHFITFAGNICERLHGHNYGLEIEVEGPLDENAYVVDFIALRDACQAIVSELDHKVLLPDRHQTIKVEPISDGAEVKASFEQKRWIFPVEDCQILPIENTTAELIASWVGTRLISDLKLQDVSQLQKLRVSVEENFGQWATVKLPL